MDAYTRTSAAMSGLLTRRYSNSFSSASQLFPKTMRTDIFNVYGLVRVADEIVDSYHGPDKRQLLDNLEAEVYATITRGFSANPVVQAFASTAVCFAIGPELITPFFASMRMDITRLQYDQEAYRLYIYGSAEVVGLMCLRIFCGGDQASYHEQARGARKLGAAFQKVNFLRDVAEDYHQLGRYYFPGSSFDTLDEDCKKAITDDIRMDFRAALPAIRALPAPVRAAVMTSYCYFERLLSMLETTPVKIIKTKRLRIPKYQKLLLLAGQTIRRRR